MLLIIRMTTTVWQLLSCLLAGLTGVTLLYWGWLLIRRKPGVAHAVFEWWKDIQRANLGKRSQEGKIGTEIVKCINPAVNRHYFTELGSWCDILWLKKLDRLNHDRAVRLGHSPLHPRHNHSHGGSLQAPHRTTSRRQDPRQQGGKQWDWIIAKSCFLFRTDTSGVTPTSSSSSRCTAMPARHFSWPLQVNILYLKNISVEYFSLVRSVLLSVRGSCLHCRQVYQDGGQEGLLQDCLTL